MYLLLCYSTYRKYLVLGYHCTELQISGPQQSPAASDSSWWLGHSEPYCEGFSSSCLAS